MSKEKFTFSLMKFKILKTGKLLEKTLYVQVAYLLTDKKTIKREFSNLLEIKDNHKITVISPDDIIFSDFKGIKHIKPWELI